MTKIRCVGLTLIEVLIALAIISIAMTAIIKTTTQNIRSTAYLQKKTIAMWVGQQVVNEARTGILLLPRGSDTVKHTTTMLGQDWHWQARVKETANKHIKKITVQVFEQEDEDEDETPLVSLESYAYVN